jgi:adenylate kinase family enzyme
MRASAGPAPVALAEVQRILVYGVTGSGKSELAARLGARLGLPYHCVDDLTWEANWVPVPPEVQRQRIAAICATDAWVLDSAYRAWRDVPLARADLIVGLDLSRWRTLSQLVRRTVRQIVHRTPTCNGNIETWRTSFLARDSLFFWHFQSFARKRRQMRSWAADPAMPTVVLLRSPAAIERWLADLPSSAGAA